MVSQLSGQVVGGGTSIVSEHYCEDYVVRRLVGFVDVDVVRIIMGLIIMDCSIIRRLTRIELHTQNPKPIVQIVHTDTMMFVGFMFYFTVLTRRNFKHNFSF